MFILQPCYNHLIALPCLYVSLKVRRILQKNLKLSVELRKTNYLLLVIHFEIRRIYPRDPQLGMFTLSQSTRHHRPNAAVICVNQIVQTCYLLLEFGSGDVPTTGSMVYSIIRPISSIGAKVEVVVADLEPMQ